MLEIYLIEPPRNPPLRALGKAVHREVCRREGTGLGMLLSAVDCKRLSPKKLPLLWGLGAGVAVRTAGACPAEHPGTRRGKVLPPAVCLQCSLLIMLNIVPAGEGNVFKGSSSIFAESARMGERH